MGAPHGFGRWVTSGTQLPPGLGAFGALSAVRLACQVTEGGCVEGGAQAQNVGSVLGEGGVTPARPMAGVAVMG